MLNADGKVDGCKKSKYVLTKSLRYMYGTLSMVLGTYM